jgi:hypothetical protein
MFTSSTPYVINQLKTNELCKMLSQNHIQQNKD